MDADILFRVIAVVAGLFLLLLLFFSLVKKKMTEGIAIGWAVGSVILIVMGVVPGLSDWADRLSITNFIILMLCSTFIIGFMFKISSIISMLMMKNQELAMQVSLLNQENERILMQLEAISEKEQSEYDGSLS